MQKLNKENTEKSGQQLSPGLLDLEAGVSPKDQQPDTSACNLVDYLREDAKAAVAGEDQVEEVVTEEEEEEEEEVEEEVTADKEKTPTPEEKEEEKPGKQEEKKDEVTAPEEEVKAQELPAVPEEEKELAASR